MEIRSFSEKRALAGFALVTPKFLPRCHSFAKVPSLMIHIKKDKVGVRLVPIATRISYLVPITKDGMGGSLSQVATRIPYLVSILKDYMGGGLAPVATSSPCLVPSRKMAWGAVCHKLPYESLIWPLS